MRVEGAQGHAPEDAEDAMGKWVEPAMDARYLITRDDFEKKIKK